MSDNAPSRVDMEAVRRELAENSRMFEAIGRFIFEFSQLEFTMKAFLAAQIGIMEEHFDAVTAPYDFHILSVVVGRCDHFDFCPRVLDLDDRAH